MQSKSAKNRLITYADQYKDKPYPYEFLDKIRPRYFGVLNIDGLWRMGCDCGAEAICVAFQVPYNQLQLIARQRNVRLDGLSTTNFMKLIKKLKVKYKDYYVSETMTQSQQLDLVYKIKTRAILTLEDVCNRSEPYSPWEWSHCVVWEPKLGRILEDQRFSMPQDTLKYYDIAHVVECTGMPEMKLC